MAKQIRLKDIEQELIADKTLEINKELIKLNKKAIKESELLHLILIDAIKRTKTNNYGTIYIK